MFGRIRASSSSLDNLEGAPSKLIKDDAFSVYEVTLMKLKLGAQHDAHLPPNNADEMLSDSAADSSSIEETSVRSNTRTSSSRSITDAYNEESTMMMIDTDSSSGNVMPNSPNSRCAGITEKAKSRNASILHLFNKFQRSKCAMDSSNEEHVSLASTSSSSSESCSSSTAQETVKSIPACDFYNS